MKINPRVAIMREVATKVVQILTSRNIKVTQRGNRAYVKYDTRTLEIQSVNIPFIPDEADDKIIDATQGFIDHELGHVFHTEPLELVRAKKLGVANLHNVLEDVFVEKKQRESYRGAAANLEMVGRFFLEEFTDKKIKEDPKHIIGYLMVPAIRAWGGQLLFQEYMDKDDKWKHIADITARLAPLIHEIPLIESTKQAVDLAVRMNDLIKGKVPPPKKPSAPPSAPKPKKEEKFEESDAAEEEQEPGPSSGASGEGTATPAEGEAGAGTPSGPEDEGTSSGSPEEAEGDSSSSGSSPEPTGSPAEEEEPPAGGAPGEEETDEKFEEEAESDEKFTGSAAGDGDEEELTETGAMGEADFGDDDDDAETSSDDDGDASKAKTTSKGAKPSPEPLEDLSGAMGDIADFDDSLSTAIAENVKTANDKSDYLIWTRDYDLVEPLDISDINERTLDERVERMQVKSDQMVGVMQKDLERAVAARNQKSWQGGLRRGRLNASSLSRLVLNDDRVFRKRQISMSKNVAITLLVDNSGSMHGSKIETAGEAAFALSSVLDRMNVTHEVIGFTTRAAKYPPAEYRKAEEELGDGQRFARSDPLYMPVYKSFDDRLDPETKRAMAAMSLHSRLLRENVDGESIQVAAQRLLARKEERHVMIVLSDGQPASDGPSPILRAHLKNSVALCEKSGIEMIGIGIESNAVENYYPKHVVLHNVDELTGEVIQKIKQMLLV